MNTSEIQVYEMIVGYDAREYWRTFNQDWPERRKQDFLYKLDILKPLSADVCVWPSIFTSEDRPEPPEKFGFWDTWSFLDDLKNAVSRYFQQEPMRAWRMIAITLVLDQNNQRDNIPWSSIIPEADPAKRDANWIFLGYDVCDQYSLSALTNCGSDAVSQRRSKWAPLLNRFHLFEHLDDAFEFKRFSDARMKDDHAPFFVFGLWIIR